MNKLRVEKNNIYTIEVNDNGDVIEFDMEDIELPFRLQRALDGVRLAQTQLRGKIAILEKQVDKKDENHIMSKNEFEALKAYKTCFADMRKALDEFVGVGGCQKIFGSTNRLNMFDDFFELLAEPQEDGLSHLDKMKINGDNVIEKIKKKYQPKSNEAI